MVVDASMNYVRVLQLFLCKDQINSLVFESISNISNIFELTSAHHR